MKKTLIAVAALIATSPMAIAHAQFGSYKITINGQNVNVPMSTGVSCEVSANKTTLALRDVTSNKAWLTGSQVTLVDLDDGSSIYMFDPDQTHFETSPLGGDASVTHSGNSYQITGHIQRYDGFSRKAQAGSSPVPFEFDVTCP